MHCLEEKQKIIITNDQIDETNKPLLLSHLPRPIQQNELIDDTASTVDLYGQNAIVQEDEDVIYNYYISFRF